MANTTLSGAYLDVPTVRTWTQAMINSISVGGCIDGTPGSAVTLPNVGDPVTASQYASNTPSIVH